MIKPRPYQIDCINKIQEARARGLTRQLISLPTGTGKTVIFALLAKQLGLRTLVLAHAEELLFQAVDKLKIIWPEIDIGLVKAGQDEVGASVVVASVQTVARDKRLQRLKEQNFYLMIIDEAHHSAAPSYVAVIKELGFFDNDQEKLLVGVTATPKRADGVALGSIYQEVVYDASIATMIRAGYLSPLIGKQIFTEIDLGGVAVQNGDFAVAELSRIVNTPERNKIIVEKFVEYAEDRKRAIAFCSDVQHSKDLVEAFKARGIAAGAIYGDMPQEERKRMLQDFSAGKIQLLSNCMVLVEGYDEAAVDCVILARPTKSASLYTQMIGRGIRTHPLKKNCLVLDFTDNCRKHSLCNFKNTLDGVVMPLSTPGEAIGEEGCDESEKSELAVSSPYFAGKLIAGKAEEIEFFDKAAFAWVPVGEAWHLRLTASRDVWLRKSGEDYLVVANDDGVTTAISDRCLPLDYALGVAEDWARRQTTKGAWARKDAAWRQEPVTQKQKETLARLGISSSQALTRGEASQLIDGKILERTIEPASAKQISWLGHHRVAIPNGLTKFQAGKLIAQTKEGLEYTH